MNDEILEKTIKNENRVIQIYNYFKPHDKIKPSNLENRYEIYDAINKRGKKYEIKCVNHYRGQFPKVLMPVSKVGACDSKGLRFLYDFKDGLYYIDYSSTRFKKKWIIKYNKRLHFYIPYIELKQICSYYDQKYKEKFGEHN
jgi:hypothetical protein